MSQRYRQKSYKTVPTDKSLGVSGLESVFEYNGLVINDLREMDCYKLTRVSGLDDADVRDSRGVNPDRDGETAFSSLYGGRTITLQGYVRAGNRDYMRYMWSNLKAATDDMEDELPLHIRWLDWKDDFLAETSDLVLQDYDVEAGTGTFAFAGGEMVPSSTAQKRLICNARTYVNNESTLRFFVGASAASFEAYTILKSVDQNNYLYAGASNGGLRIGVVVAGSPTNLATVAMPISNGFSYYVRAKVDGDNVTVALYSTHPDGDTSNALIARTTFTLVSTNKTLFGQGVRGRAGMRILPGGTDWRYGDYEVRSVNPSDMFTMCKKAAKLDGEESFSGGQWRKPFMLSFRCSSPLMLSRTEELLSASLASSTLTFPGGGGGLAFDATGRIVFGGLIGTAKNYGYAPTTPKIRFYGPCVNPAVVNVTNGTRIIINGNLLTGEYIDVDCDARTVVHSDGTSRYHMLSSQSSWLRIDPGSNDIYGGTESFGTVDVRWRHAFR